MGSTEAGTFPGVNRAERPGRLDVCFFSSPDIRSTPQFPEHLWDWVANSLSFSMLSVSAERLITTDHNSIYAASLVQKLFLRPFKIRELV